MHQPFGDISPAMMRQVPGPDLFDLFGTNEVQVAQLFRLLVKSSG